MPAPANPKIFHITHLRNLPGIIAEGGLLSDYDRLNRGLDTRVVGMGKIKQRRLEEYSVTCHPGTMVGHYVPFYFCPRSIMLFILHKGNHPDLEYTGGQEPIIHLQADFHESVEWAQSQAIRWAFSRSNAGARYCGFSSDPAQIGELNWDAIRSTDFTSPAVKEGKQAEFLLHRRFPFDLVEKIGVIDERRKQAVLERIAASEYETPVEVQRNWYF